MPNYTEAELFGYPFEGEIKPMPFPADVIYKFSVHGQTGQGTIEEFTLGQMPHKLKDGSDDPLKVRRKGSIVLLSEDMSDFYVIDFDCLYPCNSTTSILDMKCVVGAVGKRTA